MSSTLNDVRSAIEARIATEMAIAPAYPVSYQNVPYAPPNNATWVQVFITFGDANYATLIAPGTGFNRHNGVLAVNIFTPNGQGAGANYTIGERIKDLFDRAKFSGIIFDAPSGPSIVGANIIQTGASAASGLSAAYLQTQLTATFQAYLD
jgi:hypothetical protein